MRGTAGTTTSPWTSASTTTPIRAPELGRLLDLNDLYLTASTDEEKVPVDATLGEELDDRARRLGHRDFQAWVGSENYEMRVSGPDDDKPWVDQRVLKILREQSEDATPL